MRRLQRELEEVKEERDILKKRLACFPNGSDEVSVHGDIPGYVQSEKDVQGVGSLPKRVLCLEDPEAEHP